MYKFHLHAATILNYHSPRFNPILIATKILLNFFIAYPFRNKIGQSIIKIT